MLTLLLWLAPAFAQVSKPVLFSVKHGSVTSYLFGTYHYGVGLAEFPDYVREAQDKTSLHIAEADMREIAALYRLARSQPSEAIRRLRLLLRAPEEAPTLEPADIDRLVSLGIPRGFARAMGPASCFQLMARTVWFLEPFHSLEDELETRAAAAGKPILELDTDELREQAHKLEPSGPTCDMRPYLKDPRKLAELDASFARHRDWYRSLTPEGIANAPVDDDKGVSFRNHAWMKTLTPTLKSRSAFLSIGVAHLYELIQLLRAEGFEVAPYSP